MSKRINKANRAKRRQIEDQRFWKEYVKFSYYMSPEHIAHRQRELAYHEELKQRKESEAFENRKPDIPVTRNQPKRRKKRKVR